MKYKFITKFSHKLFFDIIDCPDTQSLTRFKPIALCSTLALYAVLETRCNFIRLPRTKIIVLPFNQTPVFLLLYNLNLHYREFFN